MFNQRRVLTALLVVVIFLVGCSAERRAWRKAEREKNLIAYEAYLQEHPDGQHAAAARDAIEDLSFRAAEEQNTVNAFKGFLESFPSGRHAEAALQEIEELEFHAANESGSLEALDAFLNDHPDGPMADEIRGLRDARFPPIVLGAAIRTGVVTMLFEGVARGSQALLRLTNLGDEAVRIRIPRGQMTWDLGAEPWRQTIGFEANADIVLGIAAGGGAELRLAQAGSSLLTSGQLEFSRDTIRTVATATVQ